MRFIHALVTRVSIPALLLGVFFLAASLSPSLIPRGSAVQGALGGLSMALGYLCGRIVELVWDVADMPRLRGRAATAATAVAAAIVLGVLALSAVASVRWQADLRIRMGLEPAEEVHWVQVVVIVLAVFAILYAFGVAISLLFRVVRAGLYRVMPPRRANVLGLVAVALLLFLLTRDRLVPTVFEMLDESYETAQDLFDRAPAAPTDPRLPGSPQSLVEWRAMGQPGRDFVMTGPDAGAIAAFTGAPALDPIRVYVGRANAATPEARAQLALGELLRLGAFEREVLIVASPTGTGWLDPGSHDPVEYMHGGDIATVAVQYSYMQSPLALVFETQTGLEQATATIATIHDYWKTLPRDDRPRLYIHGLSLGAWSSMHATNLFRLLNDGIDGAFWAGPPFPSAFWNYVQRARNEGSPWVLPEVGDGSLVRYASHVADGSQGAPWGDMRLMFLQYPSDPIVFYEPFSVWRPPVWMTEPPGHGVSPNLRFLPIVTQFQLAIDMAVSTTAPPGYGHSYYARDYIGPWVEVTAPEGWTQRDTERLQAHCDNGFQQGCTND
ncbi:alpha/beta-hydrolase family protein [Roseibacterium sp. SDUM158017]|uniref:alpha/beta hydrolase n=1 Tax=Roseicyclus salinarum TaxID=3036773 RepID=UPI0024154D02|nr:alpha/beta-hydrolase family protein [Roseibacterium sp. SDUM158017]MDG4649461.1 alpha/beta-hydrolase family protein [Roseibacterium sp. SDUM158017]